MMKTVLIALLVFGQAFYAFAQHEKYSRVTITANAATYARMQEMGLAVDHIHRHGNSVVAELSETELQKLRTAGIGFTVEVEDLQKYYEQRAAQDLANLPQQRQLPNACGQTTPTDTVQVPANFTLGTYAGFFTYGEMLGHLDNMATLYPNLITVKAPIAGHQTIEGRPIFWVKISDNPMQDEVATEPQVLYDAVHHAREPMSMSQTIFYMYYLLENYNSNSLIKDIVDNTELFFVPCLNPDGYLFNETSFPFGGGMWRKNRRNNGNGTMGVDLNRNYGYNWGFNNAGSSPDPSTEVYRGTGPFSEPETQAMKAFCEAHQFKNALNAHSFGNVLIHPFGYDFDVYPNPADSARFVQWGMLLTEHNNYGMGTTPQVLGYLGNGDSDAWMYGEQTTKPEIFAFTPETGDPMDGFWPMPSRIIPLAQGMLHSNLNLALVARQMIKADVARVNVIANTSGVIDFTLRNLGLENGGAVTVTLQSSSPYFVSAGSPVVYATLPDLVATTGSINFMLSNATPQDATVAMQLVVTQGSNTWVTPIERIYSTTPAAYSNSFSNTQGLATSDWGLTTTEFHTAASSLTDSPFGNYNQTSFNTQLINETIDLTNAADAFITFWAKWEIERGWDYAQVQAVTAAGTFPLCGRYSKAGNGQFQPLNEPLYDGRQPAWVEERMSLQDFIGQQIKLQFLMASDDFTEQDGIYIDDLQVHVLSVNGISDNQAISSSALGEAYPNPAGASVSVPYDLPNLTSPAQVVITDVFGRRVAAQALHQAKGIVTIDTHTLAAGVYTYALQIENTQTEAKKLVIVK